MEEQDKSSIIYTKVPHKKWGLHLILDLYILKEFLIPFAVLMIGFVVLFVIGDMCNDLSDFLRKDVHISKLFMFLILKLPGNIRFILPLSVLLSTMYTMASLGTNLEITAIRVSGVPLMRSAWSIFAMGLVVTFVNFMFNEKIVPYSEREAMIIKKDASKKKGEKSQRTRLQSMLTYRSPDGLRTWLFKYFNNEGIQKGVILKKFRTAEFLRNDERKLEWDLKAEEAEFIPGQGWEFRNVIITPYDERGFMPRSPQKHKVYQKSIDEIPEMPKEIMDLSKLPEELSTPDILNLLRKTKNMHQNLRNVYNTIFYFRLAFPWACFLAVFLGIPLAAQNERRGIMASIVVAVVIIVVYQLASEAFIVFGKRGWLPPAVAGIGPTLAFIVYGWWNVRRI